MYSAQFPYVAPVRTILSEHYALRAIANILDWLFETITAAPSSTSNCRLPSTKSYRRHWITYPLHQDEVRFNPNTVRAHYNYSVTRQQIWFSMRCFHATSHLGSSTIEAQEDVAIEIAEAAVAVAQAVHCMY